jgi:hypothetical protein
VRHILPSLKAITKYHMSESRIEPKIFTREEANSVLPAIREALLLLRRRVTDLLACEACADASALIHDAALGEDRTLEEARQALEQAFETFEQFGCLLKDLDQGLIDFYARLDGELVFLCWQDGEASVDHWHQVDDGFAGRAPLPDA